LKKKSRPALLAGMILAFAGIFLATQQAGTFSLYGFITNFHMHWFPYASAFMAAVLWALYSNFIKLYAGNIKGNAVPLFSLASGIFLAGLAFLTDADPNWTLRLLPELMYAIVFPTFLAYYFWDFAMREGDSVLVVSASYITPLFSIVISSAYLDIGLDFNILIACIFVIAGAFICNKSIR
jgi:drug/metabolite transporter (DMT)-like permease